MKQCTPDDVPKLIVQAGCGRRLDTDYSIDLDVEGSGVMSFSYNIPGFDPTDPNIVRLVRRPPVCP
jgi:hypothetical protein